MVNYGNTEVELLADESLQCRKIVKEITKFGVSQQQMLKIIELLALELENIEYAQKISMFMKELNELNVADFAENMQTQLEME